MKYNLDQMSIISFSQTEFPIFYQYQILNNEYVITQKDIRDIIEKLEGCFIKE